MPKPSVTLRSLPALLGLGTVLTMTACSVPPAAHDVGTQPGTEPSISDTNAYPGETSRAPAPRQKTVHSNPRAQAVYLLMQAELAGQRGRVMEAGKLYLQAAKLGRDPRTAERAVKIAQLARDNTTSLLALNLWIELEPQNQARWPFEVLMAVRQQDDTLALKLITQNLPAKNPARKERYQELLAVLIHEGSNVLPLLHKLAQTQHDDADAWFMLAQAAFNLKDKDSARAALRKTIQLDPARKDAYLLLAESYFSQKEIAAGIEVLGEVVRQFPKDQRLSMTYARALHEAGRTQDARTLLGRMLQTSSGDHDLRLAVALLSMESGDMPAAERELKILLRQKNHAATAAYYLGRLEEQRDHNEAALRWYTQVQGGDLATEALLRMAQIDMQAGRIQAGREHLARARALSPTDEERVRFYLIEVQLLSQNNQTQDAYNLIQQALNEVQGEPDLLYSRALMAEKLGLFAQSEADLRAILAQDPNHPEALNALGFSLAERNIRLDEAHALISQSLQLDPKSAATIDSMGWVLYRQGKLNEAETYLRQALALNQDAEIAGHLIEVLIAQQRQTEARKLLDEALKREPKDNYLLQLDSRLRATLSSPPSSSTP